MFVGFLPIDRGPASQPFRLRSRAEAAHLERRLRSKERGRLTICRANLADESWAVAAQFSCVGSINLGPCKIGEQEAGNACTL